MAKNMFTINTDVKKFQRQLKRIGKEVFPKAAAETFNILAFGVRKNATKNLKRDYVIRSPAYTLGSIRVEKATPSPRLESIHADVGSISPYLHLHDEGAVIRPRKKYLSVPTLRARRGGSYTGPVQGKYSLKTAGKIGRGGRGSGGGRFFYMKPRRRSPGFYTREAGRLMRIWGLRRKPIRLKATGWFSRPVQYAKSEKSFTRIFKRAAENELKKIGAK